MTRVAFLGLGIMGSRMAANVARAGFELTVWNRTASVAEQFGAEHTGTRVAATPADAAAEAEIVVTMVVRLNCGVNSSPKLGRFSVPAFFFSSQTGDSGRNGRITISGIAGISPDINVYRHQASCDP